MAIENKYDDEVTIIGGSEWKPGPDSGRTEGTGDRFSNGDNAANEKDGATGKWKLAAILSASACVLLAAFLIGKHLYFKAQFPKSRPDREIIEALACNGGDVKPGVSFWQTVSMGVSLRKYALNGLNAHFADTVPDCSDSSVFLVTRSADYRIKDGRRAIIGDFIQDGDTESRSNWRAGFMAVVDGRAQIGISRSGRIRRYVSEHDGSFFRQLAIISAGTRCDRQFILKGKVTRCAYARDETGTLYFIETAGPETLYGFADALIEDGFIDAVYVTGGAQADLFFREADGTAHGSYTDDKPHKLVVWTRQLP